jgi:hypothetical protein
MADFARIQRTVLQDEEIAGVREPLIYSSMIRVAGRAGALWHTG